jgi:polyisoprenoid-binding protein YceI
MQTGTGTQRGLATVLYVIDPAASRFTVQAFATGLLSAFGHNPTIGIRDYAGEIQFVPDTFEKAFVRLKVQTSAMDVLDEMKNDDRKKLEQEMYERVLDVNRFPAAVFESTQISVQKLDNGQCNGRVVGELSFHGVTRTHTFAVRATDMGTLLRISGDFPLHQSDYGIKPVSIAGGAIRLKDELKFKFEISARRQEEPAAGG